mmetsp:Transcript_32358/g.81630  ORF Transcript_32358/g.81630 Transcript_32358/m.81630 type:complete len:1052 (-) Transcript_32358:50-3205(-)
MAAQASVSRGGAWGIAPAGARPGRLSLRPPSQLLAQQQQRRRRAATGAPVTVRASSDVFGPPQEMDGVQKTMSGMATPALMGVAAVLVAGAGAVGAALGGQVPGSMKQVAQVGGGVVGAGVAVAAVAQGQEKRGKAAAIELQNKLADGSFDPANLSKTDVDAIGEKYGVTMNEKLVVELQQLYDSYLSSVLPGTGGSLTGGEAEKLRAFLDAIGLADEEAAQVHLDVGRRIMRSRFESSSRDSEVEQRRSFQQLIYASTLLFGDQKASFLLPWKRLFNITDAQLYVAKRDNAKQLFKDSLDALGGELPSDREALKALKSKMDTFKLSDDVAAELVTEASRTFVENQAEKAIACVKRRTRVKDYSEAMAAMQTILEYNAALTSMKDDEELVPGLGPISLLGGKFEEPGRPNDLKEVLKVYLEEKLRKYDGFTEEMETALSELRGVFGLGPKEVTAIRDDVVVRTYRNKLREKVASGELEAAESKAAVLQEMCNNLRFDPASAAQLHMSIYRQKLVSFLEKKALTAEDEAQLGKMRRMMCLQKGEVDAIHKELCGAIVKRAVEDALSAGYEGFSPDDRANVKKAIADVRLDEAAAKEILSAAARRAFLTYTTKSRNQKNRLDAAKELKKLVYFNTMVVGPLLDDVKSDETKEKEAKAKKEFEDIMAQAKKMEEDKKKATEGGDKAEEGAEAAEAGDASTSAEGDDEEAKPSTLAKTEAAADAPAPAELEEAGVQMVTQKDITLAEDLDKRDRLDIYKSFLLFCMSGDAVALPMGSMMVVERDQSEFQRLSQLGDVLGLNQMDVAEVHSGLAEQAFRNQVQQVLADGVLTKEKTEALTDMQKKMGLTDEKAQKVIKGVQNEKLIAGMSAAKRAGSLSLDKVMEMVDSGVEVASFVSKDMRTQLFRQKIESILSDGTGNFDTAEVLEELPEKLGLEQKAVQAVVKDVAGSRKRTTLVQAISYLRQKRLDDAVKDMNNLLACNRANPVDKPMEWAEPEELQDVFSVYMIKDKDEGKQAELQKLLGITDEQAASLKEVIASGGFRLEQEAENEGAIF